MEPLGRVRGDGLQKPVAGAAGPPTTTTSDRSTSRVTRSSTSSRATPSPVQTASAAARSQPSLWAARRRRTMRSGALSSSQLQSITARSVCWRAGAPRCPKVRTRNRSLRRSANSLTPSARTRVAASSRASGMPSSRRQISATARRSGASGASGSRGKPGAAAAARSMNIRTASAGSSGSTRNIASPARPSGSCPVARTLRPGAVRRRSSVSSAAASTTCSQLSRTSRVRRSRRAAARRCGREGVPVPVPGRECGASSRMPRVAATTWARSAGVPARMPENSTSQVPSASSPALAPSLSAVAAATANRVLPTPPGPVRVTSLASARSWERSASA